jgi:hypothetical protein
MGRGGLGFMRRRSHCAIVQPHLIGRSGESSERQDAAEGLNVLWTATCMLRKRWAEPGDLKRCSLRSRRRTAWCEFSARLFCRKPCSW